MDPNYLDLDPQERINRILSLFSILLGVVGLCGGLIPIFGIITSILGIIAGSFGRKSDSRKLATVGIVICCFSLTLSLVYGFFVYLSSPK